MTNKNNFQNCNYEIKGLNLNENNLFNKTSDNIKINTDVQKQKILNKIQKIGNLHNTYFKIIEKSKDSNTNYTNNSNVNTINVHKYIDSNRFKKKKITLNTNMISNNDIYINDLVDKNKINTKINSIKNKNNRNSNMKYKNLLDFNNKHLVNNNSVEIKNTDNINHNNQEILTEIKNKSKVYNKNINNKSISINNAKMDFNLLNIKNFQYNTLNTELNFNKDDYNNKLNPFENVKTKRMILLKDSNVNPKRRAILKTINKIK